MHWPILVLYTFDPTTMKVNREIAYGDEEALAQKYNAASAGPRKEWKTTKHDFDTIMIGRVRWCHGWSRSVGTRLLGPPCWGRETDWVSELSRSGQRSVTGKASSKRLASASVRPTWSIVPRDRRGRGTGRLLLLRAKNLRYLRDAHPERARCQAATRC
jgi:hypothetical protein